MAQRSDDRTVRRVLPTVARWGSRVLFAVLVAAVLLLITVLLLIPRVTNGAALTVLTGSMTPDIPVGSVVVVRPVDPGTLRVGDVATYQAEPGREVFITHRVVRIDDSTTPAAFTFKGDANRGEDIDPVPATAIRGQVWFHVPYLGSLRDSVQGPAALGLLATLLLSLYAMAQLLSALREHQALKRGKDTGADAASGAGSAGGGSAADEGLTLGHTLVVARFEGGPGVDLEDEARLAAQEMGGVVADRDDKSFTLLFAPEAHLRDLLLDVVATHHPDRVQVLTGPVEIRSAAVAGANADPGQGATAPVGT